MKIYTGTGDSGETALFGGGRVPKHHPRIEACGAVDELNAVLGRALSVLDDEELSERLSAIQHDLFALGAYLASPDRDDGRAHGHLPPLPESRPAEMEGWIDEASRELSPLTEFILPGGSPGAVELHVCRTVCRRAERAVVRLLSGTDHDGGSAPAFTVRYLNRLSDLLFVLARLENHRTGTGDVPWNRQAR